MTASLLLLALVGAGEPAQRYVVQADQHLVEASYRRGLTASIGAPDGPLRVVVGAEVVAERLELRLLKPDIVAWWRADVGRLRQVIAQHATVLNALRTQEREP